MKIRAIAVVALALLPIASACSVFGGDDKNNDGQTQTPGASSTRTADQTPAAGTPGVQTTSPEEALRNWVANRLNVGFVADCADARRPQDVGKQCATFRGERDGNRAYGLGPAFSEYTRLFILQPAGDSWTIAHLENRDPNEPPVPGIPWPLQVGASVVVAGTAPQCLRVRERPGTLATEVACLDDGTLVSVAEGPVDIDNLEWWRLEGYGWAASNWLRYPEDVPEVPTATPEE